MTLEISIVIPTQRRPDRLLMAARSVMNQAGVDPALLELVVVDNDPAGSARAAVAKLMAEAAFPVSYIHAAKPGVATARNAGVAAAKGRYIAFLDDDEEAPAGWLAALIGAQSEFGADVVFGAVRARIPASVANHRDYLETFFGRVGPAEAGVIDHAYGCGNSLIRKSLLAGPEPFSVARDRIGGEDDLLFAQLAKAGARFAWSPQGWVWEEAVPDRLTLAYTLKRAFAYGQGPGYSALHASPPRLDKAAFWMGVGMVQMLIHGAEAALKFITKAPDRAFAIDRAARGLGKVLWFPPFKVAFYGMPEAPKPL
ncbi:glycosyltransferase family 2 protein [soil metagenome]